MRYLPLIALFLTACGPDLGSMKDCGGRVYLEDLAGDCEGAAITVREARGIALLAGQVPEVDIIFMASDSFDSPCGEVDGCAGLSFVMVDRRGSSLTHELLHHVAGPGHANWAELGYYGLDSFSTTRMTGHLATSADESTYCWWPMPTATQAQGLRALDLPIDAWMTRVKDMQTFRGCKGS